MFQIFVSFVFTVEVDPKSQKYFANKAWRRAARVPAGVVFSSLNKQSHGPTLAEQTDRQMEGQTGRLGALQD